MSQCAQCESDGIHNFHKWGFRADLLTLFGDKDIDFLHETPNKCNSIFQFFIPLIALHFFLHKYV